MLEGIQFYAEKNIALGNLSSKSIYINPLGTIKISDSAVFQEGFLFQEFEKLQKKGGRNQLYLAPGLLQNKEQILNEDIFLGDIFTLGMILLEVCLLETCDDCYDYQNFIMQEFRVEEKLYKIKSMYGNELFYFIKQLLQFNSGQQIDIFQLQNQLQKILVSKNIDFEIQEYPEFGSLNKPVNSMQSCKENVNPKYEKKIFDKSSKQQFYKKQNHSILKNKEEVFTKDNGKSYRGKISLSKSKQKQRKKVNFIKNSEVKLIVEENQKGQLYYEGEKLKNGMKEGKGKMVYPSGIKYIGEWKKDQMHGHGILYYKHGKICYEGEFAQSKFHGNGTLYNDFKMKEKMGTVFDYNDLTKCVNEWVKYKGQFFNDKREGQGKLFLGNGERFVGMFENDMVTGRGQYFQNDGRVVNGIWRANKLVQQK